MSEGVSKDIVIPLGAAPDGSVTVARIQGSEDTPMTTSIGVIRPTQEGVPINDEVIRLHACEGGRHYHAETLIEDPYKAERQRARSAGGSKTVSFASPAFQANYDRIFRKPKPTDIN